MNGDMDRLFASPHLVDGLLVVVALEGFVLTFMQRGRRRAIALMLLPGMCLMLAIRAALAGAVWPWVPVALTAAFLAHVADIRERWRG